MESKIFIFFSGELVVQVSIWYRIIDRPDNIYHDDLMICQKRYPLAYYFDPPLRSILTPAPVGHYPACLLVITSIH